MALIEAQTVLGDHIQLSAKRTERFAIGGMRVACGVDVWTCAVDGGVDGEGGGVDGFVALDDFAGFVDEDKVRDADL